MLVPRHRSWGEIVPFLSRSGRWGSVDQQHIRDYASAIAKDIGIAYSEQGSPDAKELQTNIPINIMILGLSKQANEHFQDIGLPNWGADRFLQWIFRGLRSDGISKEVANHICYFLNEGVYGTERFSDFVEAVIQLQKDN